MKHIFITCSLLFAFATGFAQTKNNKDVKVPVNVITVTKKSQKPNDQNKPEVILEKEKVTPEERRRRAQNNQNNPEVILEKEKVTIEERRRKAQNNQNRPEKPIKADK